MDRLITQLGKSKIILFFIVGMGLIFGYLSYSNTEGPVIIGQEAQLNRTDLDFFKTFKLVFTIFDDERYKALEIYGENPVLPGFTGERKNPFAPF